MGKTTIVIAGDECSVDDYLTACSVRAADGTVSYPLRRRSDCVAEMALYLGPLLALVGDRLVDVYLNEGSAALHWGHNEFVDVVRAPLGRKTFRSSQAGASNDRTVAGPADLRRHDFVS